MGTNRQQWALISSAYTNDFGYEHVFAEQLASLVKEGDIVNSINGNGDTTNSPSVSSQSRRGGYARRSPCPMRRAVFLDRDGAISENRPDYVKSLSDLPASGKVLQCKKTIY